MKIYEKPLVDIKTFDVEDVMVDSGNYSTANGDFGEIVDGASYEGVVFEW